MGIYVVSALLALTLADWLIIVAMVIGGGGVVGVGTLVLGARQLRVTRQKVEADTRATSRTVAADEAEKAVIAMAAAHEAQIATLAARTERCERQARRTAEEAARCEARWQRHLRVCPMLFGKEPDAG